VALAGILSGSVAMVVFAGVAVLVDRRDAASILGRLRRRPGPAGSRGQSGTAGTDLVAGADRDDRVDGREA
jgi:hypothetical protein